MPSRELSLYEHYAGLLIGTAVGDALGLPAEGVSRGRIKKFYRGVWRHRFILGCGMVSDDTEHTLFVAQALLTYPDDATVFRHCLARKFQLWLLGMPAGIGLATLKSILRLWLGYSPECSGVFSAGNGPAMRSAIIGAYFANDESRRRAYVSASTRITHIDPKAETAALAVAETAAWALNANFSIDHLFVTLAQLSNDTEWKTVIEQIVVSLKANKSVLEFADAIGLERGITGYAYHTVPVALYAFVRHGDDYRAVLEAVLNCGGDTDTVGAITGALIGARIGAAGIPGEWRDKICDQPRSIKLLNEIAHRLGKQKLSGIAVGPVCYFWPLLLVRNLIFLLVVLIHGFRRLLPPY